VRGFAYDIDTAVVPAGAGRYTGTLTDRWHIGVVPNGGYVLGVALNAIGQTVHHPHPLTASSHYLGPSEAGPVEVQVEVLKEGRSLSTAIARVIQGGRARLTTIASFADLAAQTGPTLLTLDPPALPPPDECVPRRPPTAAVATAFHHVIDFRPSPRTAGWIDAERGQPAQIEGWIRFADGRPPDAQALPMLCDAMPPALFAAMETGWVPTLELTTHVRGVPADGWLAARVATRALMDGLAEEDCELWDSAGRLVAMSRQLARILPRP